MTLTEVRAIIKARFQAGLITAVQAATYNRRLSSIAARDDLHWSEKKKLFSIYK